MPNLIWSKLESQQLGRCAEYYAMIEFTSYGHEVYPSEVDDHGVDFVAKVNGQFCEVQVKSICRSNYAFIPKHLMKDITDKTRLVCLLRFVDNKLPDVYIIPATAWQKPNGVIVDYEYGDGKKSKPEWGVRYSQQNADLLEQYKAAQHFETKPVTGVSDNG